MLAPATAPSENGPQSSRVSTIGIISDVVEDARQDDVEISDAFWATWNPFAPVTPSEFFDNDEYV
jgi:hypothetical protein